MRRPVPASANSAASLTLVVLSAVTGSSWSAEVTEAPSNGLVRDTLTGDWGGGRTWLQEHGVTVEPRLSQFYQGINADDGDDGYYYDGFSQSLKDAVADIQTIRDEAGLEVFYDFELTPWCHVGADLQVIRPGLGESTAVIPGLRAVIRM